MKYIKLFEEIGGGYGKDNPNARIITNDKTFPKKEFGKFTKPEEPFKRKLTNDEIKFMFRNFKNHSWSAIDANGNIVLGGGASPMGKYYITEEDLDKFMKEEKGE